MIELYTWTTPNGRRASIMLEEMGLPYDVKPIDLSREEQKSADYRSINPTGKIPAVRDTATGRVIFESGAIVFDLAARSGQLLPTDTATRNEVVEQFLWQAGGVGSEIGMAYFLTRRQPENPLAERLRTGVSQTLGVMDERLAQRPYLGCDEYTIADVMAYPWLVAGLDVLETSAPNLVRDWKHLRDWMARVGERPAVRRGMAVPAV
jgi:GSH-dependent disulfide-bond oxidoreductase